MDDAHALKNIPLLLSHTQTRRSRASLSLSPCLSFATCCCLFASTRTNNDESLCGRGVAALPLFFHTHSLSSCARGSPTLCPLCVRARNAMHTKHTSFSCILSSPSKRLRAIFDDDVLLLAKNNTTHTTRGFSLLLITCGFSLLIKTCKNALCDHLPQPGWFVVGILRVWPTAYACVRVCTRPGLLRARVDNSARRATTHTHSPGRSSSALLLVAVSRITCGVDGRKQRVRAANHTPKNLHFDHHCRALASTYMQRWLVRLLTH